MQSPSALCFPLYTLYAASLQAVHFPSMINIQILIRRYLPVSARCLFRQSHHTLSSPAALHIRIRKARMDDCRANRKAIIYYAAPIIRIMPQRLPLRFCQHYLYIVCAILSIFTPRPASPETPPAVWRSVPRRRGSGRSRPRPGSASGFLPPQIFSSQAASRQAYACSPSD